MEISDLLREVKEWMSNRTHRRLNRLWLVALCCLATTSPAVGQAPRDSLRGVVMDSLGSPIRNATLRLSGSDARMWSDQRGRFSFGSVSSGDHVLHASMVGYRPMDTNVVVSPGHPLDVAIVLRAIPFRPETLPPRTPRPASADTAPDNAETIDPVARVARLPLLRPSPQGSSGKELRIWIGFGMGIPMQLVRITVAEKRVHGEEILWLSEPLDIATSDSSWHEFMREMPAWLGGRCGGRRVVADTLAHSSFRRVTAACRVSFRPEPDWGALLTELEAHDVWTLPDDSELSQIANVIVLDGVGMVVEAWNGIRYHSYSYGNPDDQPAPQAKHAAAIMHRLLSIGAVNPPASR
jgi:hypothetical protein